MNEEMEAEIIKTDSRPENLAVSENASVDEAVPIDIRKEQKKKAYKQTMSQDIKNIDTYETRTKVNTTKWRPIYEVIDEVYIKDSIKKPEDFIRDCKNNSNEARDIPRDVKKYVEQMAMEQSLYAQVVKLHRKALKYFATDKKNMKLN